MPSAVTAIRFRAESVGEHDVANGGTRDLLPQSHLPQRAMDTGLTPAVDPVLGGDANNQLLDGCWRHQSTTFASLLAGRSGLAFPSLERLVGDQHKEVGSELPESLLGSQHFAPLGWGDAHRGFQAITEDVDLEFQELDSGNQEAEIPLQDDFEQPVAVNGSICLHSISLHDKSGAGEELSTPPRGIAIPHARIMELERPIATFARLTPGVPVANRRETARFLFILAQIAECDYTLERLGQAGDASAIQEALTAGDRAMPG
jgi:hypothetical protein